MEGSFAGILHTKNDTLADAVKDEGTDILFRTRAFLRRALRAAVPDLAVFLFSRRTHWARRCCTRKRVSMWVTTKGKVVFDLYSGTGTIAQILAPVAEKVVGVEIVGGSSGGSP